MNKVVQISFCLLASLYQLHAQRVLQQSRDLVLEDSQGQRTSLGKGFNPIPISQNKFLIIRGAQMGFGEEASC